MSNIEQQILIDFVSELVTQGSVPASLISELHDRLTSEKLPSAEMLLTVLRDAAKEGTP